MMSNLAVRSSTVEKVPNGHVVCDLRCSCQSSSSMGKILKGPMVRTIGLIVIDSKGGRFL